MSASISLTFSKLGPAPTTAILLFSIDFLNSSTKSSSWLIRPFKVNADI
ncbi:MAG: hypothetical protein RXQ80_03295 [Sulfolobaceae archaeon]|nr:hypothetical protein [Sulfolobaceae archaeon]